MTRYLAGYDTERPECVPGVRRLARIHRDLRMPATFFVVGRVAEEFGRELRRLLDDELFDIQSHTYDHTAVESQPREEAIASLRRNQDVLRRELGASPTGLRLPGGLARGLQDHPDVLAAVHEVGFDFVSADTRGPNFDYRAPLQDPYWYAQWGYPDLLEMPGHSWHDNILTGQTPWTRAPKPEGWAPARTPDEVFAQYREDLDRAVEMGLRYFQPITHPWSLVGFDEGCEHVRLLLQYAIEIGLAGTTFAMESRLLREPRRSAET